MENLNIGIIGTGYLGKLHSKLLVDAERADFIGVYDSDEVEAQKVADSFGVERFENSEKLFDFVDAVIIFDGETPLDLITKIKPNMLIKGGDYDVLVTDKTNKK